MLKLKFSTNLALVVLGIVSFQGGLEAQNNLTAKANNTPPVAAAIENDRAKDGLAGPVRRVRTEVAKVEMLNGKPIENKRVVLETASYDIKGSKLENQYFPVAGSTLTGKEVYKYDDMGNISEMTLLNTDGTLLSKEVYKYDYDSIGNWTRMTASVAVVEGGKVAFEPSEVTYRSIMYYFDENMLKLAQPTASAAIPEAKPVVSNPQPAEIKSLAVNKPADKPPVAANNKAAVALPSVSSGSKVSQPSSAVLTAGNMAPNTVSSTRVELESEPPAVPLPRILKPVSGGVLNGKAVDLPMPVYPEPAKRMRTSGLVMVEVVVDENGRVISAQATSGPAILRESAVLAALKARFSSTKLSGQPVKVAGVINYKFSLTQ